MSKILFARELFICKKSLNLHEILVLRPTYIVHSQKSTYLAIKRKLPSLNSNFNIFVEF